MKSDIKNSVVCPACKNQMQLTKEETSFDYSRGNKEYMRSVYHCKTDDIWISQETPKKIQKQITVFSGVLIKDDKVLMVLRSEPELPEAHLKWEFPGGKCDFGETPQESLAREFLEETNIEVKVKTLLRFIQTNYWNYPWGTQQTLCFIFLCTFVKQHPIKKKDHHIEKIEWFTFAEARKLDSLPGTHEVLDLVENELKKE